MTTQFCDAVCYRNFCAVIRSLPSQPCPLRPPPLTSVTDPQACTQALEIKEALQFRGKMATEWMRHLSLATLMNQAAGEMAHCAWMASCASGTLPQSMPVATPAGGARSATAPHSCDHKRAAISDTCAPEQE
eukprot:2378747-Pyramimonas_sp.AAC.1